MALNKGRPVYLEERNSEVAESIRELASRFVESKSKQTEQQPEAWTLDREEKRRGLFRRK
jgi:MinD-like ATPase involved in chromosome partitioning or flagellar assembly